MQTIKLNFFKKLLLMVGITICLTACNSGGTGNSTLPQISMPPQASVVNRSTSVITASIPASTDIYLEIIFSSNNTSIASPRDSICPIPPGQTSCNITIRGESVGNAIISAIANGYSSASSDVTVVTPPPLTINYTSIFLNIGESAPIIAAIPAIVGSDVTVNFNPSTQFIATTDQSCTIPSGSLSCASQVTATGTGTVPIVVYANGYGSKVVYVTVR